MEKKPKQILKESLFPNKKKIRLDYKLKRGILKNFVSIEEQEIKSLKNLDYIIRRFNIRNINLHKSFNNMNVFYEFRNLTENIKYLYVDCEKIYIECNSKKDINLLLENKSYDGPPNGTLLVIK